MDFQTAVKTCFRKYATFSGRATRSEFWWFMLFLAIPNLICAGIDHPLFHTTSVVRTPNAVFYGYHPGPVQVIIGLLTVLPTLAAGARRLHDTNRSGWWQVVGIVPLFGMIVLIIFLAQGARDENRYGPPPLPA